MRTPLQHPPGLSLLPTEYVIHRPCPAAQISLVARGKTNAACPPPSQVEDTPNVPPPAYSSPGDDNTQITAVASESEVERDVKEKKHVPEPAAVTTAAAIKATAEATYEELKSQLIKAEATIANLKNEAASGLRQRKTAASSEKAAAPGPELAQAVRQGTEGVPVHVVAGLCLFSFLLAYFFF